MLYLETTTDTFVPWGGEAIAGIKYSNSIEAVWTSAELAKVGLYSPSPAAAVPEGKRVVSMTVQRINSKVQFVHVLEDLPAKTPADFPLSRRQVRKAMVFAGLGLDSVMLALTQFPPGEERDVAVIDWEDAPVYLRSHPMFDSIAPLVGVTPAQLDSLWMWAASIDP